jgi:hypothetical protein
MSVSFHWLLIAALSALLLPACSSKTQHSMHAPAAAVSQLQAFKAQAKFDADSLYTGAWPAEIRPVLNAVLNQSADEFIRITAAQPTQEQYLQALAAGLAQIDADELDTEDRERVAAQYQELMDIVGLPSSDGQLNKFVYGGFLGGLVSESNLPKQ